MIIAKDQSLYNFIRSVPVGKVKGKQVIISDDENISCSLYSFFLVSKPEIKDKNSSFVVNIVEII